MDYTAAILSQWKTSAFLVGTDMTDYYYRDQSVLLPDLTIQVLVDAAPLAAPPVSGTLELRHETEPAITYTRALTRLSSLTATYTYAWLTSANDHLMTPGVYAASVLLTIGGKPQRFPAKNALIVEIGNR